MVRNDQRRILRRYMFWGKPHSLAGTAICRMPTTTALWGSSPPFWTHLSLRSIFFRWAVILKFRLLAKRLATTSAKHMFSRMQPAPLGIDLGRLPKLPHFDAFNPTVHHLSVCADSGTWNMNSSILGKFALVRRKPRKGGEFGESFPERGGLYLPQHMYC